MYAILRRYACDPAKRDQARSALAEVRRLHEAQPGYVGSLVIETGESWIAVNLWETEQAAAAGREAIGPRVRGLLGPLGAGPSELLAAGQVVDSAGGPIPRPAR